MNAPTPSAPPSASPKKPSASRLKRRTAAAVCAGGLAACTGAQVRPPPRDCPSATLAAMDKVRLYPGHLFDAYIDTTRLVGAGDAPVPVRDGAIVSRSFEAAGRLPEGTLFYGQLWTGDKDVVWGRYTQAQPPGQSQRIPVCVVLGDIGSWLKHPEDEVPQVDRRPGASYLPLILSVRAVDRFE